MLDIFFKIWYLYVGSESCGALVCAHAVVEVMENLAFLANASNLVTYLLGFMHLSLSRSANTVTNFMGTSFLLALLGGFLSDSLLSTYHIYLISALIEFFVSPLFLICSLISSIIS